MDANPPLACRLGPFSPRRWRRGGTRGVRSGRCAGPRPQGSSRPLGSSAPARRLQRRATGNRESTRMDANPPLARRFRTSPPAFGIPLSARGEGERGGEVGTPASGDGEPRIHANGRESAPGPQVSHLTPSLRLAHEGVRSARPCRATGNRECTRMGANPPLARRFRTSPPAFGIPLSARGEGERGGEVGTPSGAIPSVWIRVIRGCREPNASCT